MEPLPNAVRYYHSGDGIAESFAGSCERLGTSQVDILHIHDIGSHTHGKAGHARHMADLMGSGLDRLRRLREQGQIRAFGLGVNETQVGLDVMA